MINADKLHKEIVSVGIEILGCNSNGLVWDLESREIQDRPDVKAIIDAHDTTPIPVETIDEKIGKMQADIKNLKDLKVDKEK